MLGNTVALTIAGSSKTLTLINSDSYGSEYYLRESLQEYRFKVKHSKVKTKNGSVDRHYAELIRTVFATATTPEYEDRTSMSFSALPGRSSVDLASGLAGWGTASSNANLTKLDGWES